MEILQLQKNPIIIFEGGSREGYYFKDKSIEFIKSTNTKVINWMKINSLPY